MVTVREELHYYTAVVFWCSAARRERPTASGSCTASAEDGLRCSRQIARWVERRARTPKTFTALSAIAQNLSHTVEPLVLDGLESLQNPPGAQRGPEPRTCRRNESPYRPTIARRSLRFFETRRLPGGIGACVPSGRACLGLFRTLSPERGQLRLKFGNSDLERADHALNVGRGIARSDVLRTVPVKGDHVDEEEPFNGRVSA